MNIEADSEPLPCGRLFVTYVSPADVDERAIRETLQADNSGIEPADVAEVLARAKAETISRQRPDALVIGAICCVGVCV
jgi:predicted house-cleaning NTP pyrophosphatase (Maf/HAM1 superfamily)